jgi:hypothetical protein
MTDDGLSENEGALAGKYYGEPRWSLAQTLAWIAIPKIETLANYEATFFGRTLARITKQKIAAIARSSEAVLRASGYASGTDSAEGLASHDLDEVDELLRALKADKLRAIGPNNNPMPPEFWDDQSSVDPRIWPNVRFWREELLRLWPAASASDGVAEGATLKPDEPSAASELSTPKPKLGHDEESITRLSEFLERHYDDARRRGVTTNRGKAKDAAEGEFRAEIQWKPFRAAFTKAKIENEGGRPKKPAKNS